MAKNQAIGQFTTLVHIAVPRQQEAGLAMTFSTDIHGVQGMNPTDFDDPVGFHSLTIRLIFLVSSEMSQQLLDGF